MKKMNKRADIPVTILVIGVVALCAFALLSFNFSPKVDYGVFAEPYVIADVISISEQISFYEKQGIDFSGLAELKKAETGNKISIIKNEDGSYYLREEFRNSDGLIFSVEYNFDVEE